MTSGGRGQASTPVQGLDHLRLEGRAGLPEDPLDPDIGLRGHRTHDAGDHRPAFSRPVSTTAASVPWPSQGPHATAGRGQAPPGTGSGSVAGQSVPGWEEGQVDRT